MTQLRCSDLRTRKAGELDQQLNELQEELLRLKTAGSRNVDKIDKVEKSIVHVHIVQNQTRKDNLRSFYQGAKYKPKDLRPKQTRAKRRELTEKEASCVLKKTQRKNSIFPKRTFAVKE
ncbi:unnamed protein product [Adineta ricciae]|uniref:Large ribosomal subunit protein uL29 n=1 Tax=Adineta ricciae TaxID=249248 RepID=A0A814GXP9_ADIRI|nr:unnamed protein product [Adineta ricciae]CAF1001937.1 unnamed protein product [Adineta ricciae]